MKKLGRLLLLSATAALLAAPAARGQAVDYPQRPITLIVPFEVGGPTDILGRIVAETLSAKIGQTVIVENKGGAGGAIGSEAIAKAAPDGYTIGLATISTHVVNPSCNKHLRYDPLRSFTPVALLGSMPNILVVRQGFGTPDFAAFRERLKKDSEQYNLGTAGPCSFGHVMLEHLNQELGSRIAHVPYRGSGPAASDLLGGSLDMMMDIYPLLGPHIAAGKLTALAVAWPSRLSRLPDTPTFDELGLPDLSTTSWYGLVAPAGLPADRLAGLSRKIGESLQDPRLRRRFEEAYIHAAPQESPQAFKDFLAAQFSKESAFIQSRNMGAN
ncbi:tripartite tricarboxylate transporter substrate binding protein BugE [Bordetella bronchiseptica]|uniref:Exported protein n=1 Tax=Bordetella bronchiseptica (strain ATCC BAA-588 / NCTC 13252 / RB50) TaxID=257310 RepID=A0A0H3M0J9_BORBR|nr:tripartite tricarboxylate transporter substrate binding protein BugE [Bordetella bronchiseptica]KAK63527.1 tripartite tricarboxylate transporter family receptor [Bordetella bronchiseptica 980-2]KDD57865.1 tripartite tricarboxylate transporter family receptor [Bordetella bronchiseptica OSU553]AUV49684.1 tripartite tricarboxylate transporter substrate binding protein BugE [Bordetella bronchiseptica]KCV50542.1 tripartite tricarboxylate transporter family receptor [Bordetella bronchiseptica 3E44